MLRVNIFTFKKLYLQDSETMLKTKHKTEVFKLNNCSKIRANQPNAPPVNFLVFYHGHNANFQKSASYKQDTLST